MVLVFLCTVYLLGQTLNLELCMSFISTFVVVHVGLWHFWISAGIKNSTSYAIIGSLSHMSRIRELFANVSSLLILYAEHSEVYTVIELHI